MPYEPYSITPNPYTYNPMLGYQSYMQSMGNAQQPLQQSQQPSGIKGRAVSGIEEARAAQIDFDGSPHFFPDTANGKIYTKQIGMNGTAVFNVYDLQPQDAPAGDDPIARLEKRIAEMEEKIKLYEEVMENGAQSATNTGTVAKQRKSNGDDTTAGGK